MSTIKKNCANCVNCSRIIGIDNESRPAILPFCKRNQIMLIDQIDTTTCSACTLSQESQFIMAQEELEIKNFYANSRNHRCTDTSTLVDALTQYHAHLTEGLLEPVLLGVVIPLAK